MPIYLVDISMRTSSHDYSALWSTLKKVKAQSVMDASWLIDVKEDLQTVTNALLAFCAKGDALFVVEIAPETRWSGTGLKDAEADWLWRRMKVVRSPDRSEARKSLS